MTAPKGVRQAWLERATRLIRFGPDRRAAEEELDAHWEDSLEQLLRDHPEMERQEAEQRVAGRMGDPDEVGRALARLHRPWWGWLWRASQLALAAAVAAVCLLTIRQGGVLGDDPYAEWWDGDLLPRYAEERYQPGQEGCLWTRPAEWGREVSGQHLRAGWAALYEEEGQRVLYLTLRLSNWRAWELGVLWAEEFALTDDVGNQYALGLEGPIGPDGELYSRLQICGYGPFHRNYELRVYGIASEAQRLWLEYGGGRWEMELSLEPEEEAVE
ncbi:MAG: hypothetical protein ACOX7F_06535 [Eubacteriales bacterium]|jgi:hypothetical protein